ncbi:MAG: hypothetical protein ACHP9S_07540 [Terriglobales bacterium]
MLELLLTILFAALPHTPSRIMPPALTPQVLLGYRCIMPGITVDNP